MAVGGRARPEPKTSTHKNRGVLAKFTDMSWQTLHRRYRGRPTRMRPPPENDTWLRSRHRPKRVVTVSFDDNW